MEKKKIGKRIKEKGNGEKGGRERKKEGEGAVRASGDRGSGRPRAACGPREVGHAVGGEEGKGEREKRGRDSRRPVTTRRVGWEGDGTWIEVGCRVVRGRFWGLGFRV
jgi:hypothetical protein